MKNPARQDLTGLKLKDYRSLFVAIDFLTAFMTLLGLDGQRRNWTCIETLQRNGFAGFFTIAIGTLIQSLQCGIDLRNELPLAVACSEFDRAIGLRRGPVGEI